MHRCASCLRCSPCSYKLFRHLLLRKAISPCVIFPKSEPINLNSFMSSFIRFFMLRYKIFFIKCKISNTLLHHVTQNPTYMKISTIISLRYFIVLLFTIYSHINCLIHFCLSIHHSIWSITYRIQVFEIWNYISFKKGKSLLDNWFTRRYVICKVIFVFLIYPHSGS